MIFFVSDLHLCSSRPEICRIFFDFLAGPARRAQALYVLGDLFEYWAGDEDVGDPFNAGIVEALRTCAVQVPVHVMHGNRDFLLGRRFADAAGVHLIDDPLLLDCNGVATLLTHGDALCTDDADYMRFRAEVRSKPWIDAFMSTPLAERKARIAELRLQSDAAKQHKQPGIMDVNPLAVETLLRAYGYPLLIHGHTHRPGTHVHALDGHKCERRVLADWYENGSCLRADSTGLVSITLG